MSEKIWDLDFPLPQGTDLNRQVDELTTDDVLDFVTDKKIKITCRECGSPCRVATTRGASQKQMPVVMSINPENTEIEGANINFYFQMICVNCGNLRMFEREIVARWKLRKLHER